MCGKYLDLEDLSHLDVQYGGGSIYDHNRWRESYYFNMTDPRTGYSLITTIGILPNKKRRSGFVLLLRRGKVLLIRPLVSFGRQYFNEGGFSIGGLEYSVEGINWRLRYQGGNCSFDILFSPLNGIYRYLQSKSDIAMFRNLGSQHFEQFGRFEGVIRVKGNTKLVSCLGHRDHSWGIRDWHGVDNYRLFSCALSENMAFNLWQGSINGNTFQKGFVFDGTDNTDISHARVLSDYVSMGMEPKSASIIITDNKGRHFRIHSRVICSLPFLPYNAVIFESIGKMQYRSLTGYGLHEYHYRLINPLWRLRLYGSALMKAGGWARC